MSEPRPFKVLQGGLSQGLHMSISMADYIADPCVEPSLSASTVRRLVEQSPLKAWKDHPRLGGEVSYSEASDVGSAAHAMVLEGESIIKVVAKVTKADGEEIVPKTWQTNDAKAVRDKIRKEGKVPLLPHKAPGVYAMAKRAGEAMEAEAGKGDPEVTLIWQEKNGVWCRARCDWLPHDLSRPVFDYKTTKASANPPEWIRRSLFQQGHDVEAAFYLRGLRAVGQERGEFKFLVQEQDAPYDFGWVGLEAGCEAIDQVDKWIEKAIHVWGECLKSGSWPGYPKHTFYADPPSWRAIQIEESELAEKMARDTFGGDGEIPEEL